LLLAAVLNHKRVRSKAAVAIVRGAVGWRKWGSL
jgi:hypothetical protein